MIKFIFIYIEKMRGGNQAIPRAPWHEIFWSGVGAFAGIFLIYYVGHLQSLHLEDSLFLVGSFGASAVLLYGIPDSHYSQPRNLIGGHIISAIIGVTCTLVLTSNPSTTAAAAVSLSLVFMHLTRTVHPPGGATALIAVVGSDHIHQMSYMFVITPIASGALIMLVVAVVVNNFSPHRRYPSYWI